jgi:hypothetical protein
MNIVISVALSYLIILAVLTVIGGPFLIGRERRPYTAGNYLFEVSWCVCVVIVAGRLINWW